MSEPVGTPRTFRVRPYTLTGGRTRTDVELSLDTVLEAADGAGSRTRRATGQGRRIVELCSGPTPLAEIAGRVGQPLQVVSILVADLLAAGALVQVVATPDGDDRPDLQLLERVLDGLNCL